MTNLLATIIVTSTTNWTTTSYTTPATQPGNTMHAVYRPTMANQTGTVYSNLVARVEWNGKQVEAVLESTPVRTEERSVDAFANGSFSPVFLK
jgi:hypothetical protein